MRHKGGGDCGVWVLNEINKENYPENMKKKSSKPFGSYLVPTHFRSNWAGLAVLFSR